MSTNTQLFGSAYISVVDFQSLAEMFGAGMALADYPDGPTGELKLLNLLAAASRAVDAYCCRSFTPGERSEQHALDLKTWRFGVNNPPVSEITGCVLRYSRTGTIVIPPANVYISNQEGYCEITRTLDGAVTIMEMIGTELREPQVEVTYKSLQDVPSHVKLATGYQAGHMMNTGFVDKILPPNFGRVELDGLAVNNKKGYKSAEEMESGSFSPDAKRLLAQEINFSVA